MAAGATYEPIATNTLSTAAASITFSSIAATYTDLRLIFSAPAAAASYYIYLELNGDTGANYSRTMLFGNGTTPTSSTSSADNFALVGYQSATVPTFQDINIFSYAGSKYKTLLTSSSQDQNGSGSVYRIVGLWQNTAAITSIAIKPQTSTFATGTIATLYGIKAA